MSLLLRISCDMQGGQDGKEGPPGRAGSLGVGQPPRPCRRLGLGSWLWGFLVASLGEKNLELEC